MIAVAGPAAIVERLAPGTSLYLPGSAGEPTGIIEALQAEGAPALDIASSFVPGVNPLAIEKLPPGSRFACPFAHATKAEAARRAMFRQLPLSYGGFAKHMAERLRFDACVVHVSPPDGSGNCSLGPSVEFTEIAIRRSDRLFGVINPRLPACRHSPAVPLKAFEAVTEVDAPLRVYDVGAPSAPAASIAGHVAPFVGDGCTLQVGLGKAPDALMRLLADRRGLRLFSGMLSDGAMMLAEAGCLDPGFRHTSCVGLGSEGFYAWLAGRGDFAIAGCDTTHDPTRLAAQARFVAVNSAVSVDLLGQANLEMLDGRMISGVGGAPDFSRAAALARDGLSIIALPSVGGREAASRIVPALESPVSIPRHDIDVVVTEHGAADLRGLSAGDRAARIAEIAAPEHREGLMQAARAIADRF